MAPFDLVALFGKFWGYLIFFVIGVGFGAVLEMSGFGDSRKLAAQFYFKEMRVLKVMFTAIVVALVLIFFSSAIGILDFRNIWVNPTYLLSGITGGLIMGVGFIMGGFCPGTSVVAASTLKLDGIFFLTGVFFGVGLFGETVGWMQEFYEHGELERFLLSDLFGLSTGLTVMIVVSIALFAFYWAEIAEKIFGEGKHWEEIDFFPSNRRYILSGIVLFSIAVAITIIGQPNAERKWNLLSKKYESILEKREIYVHPLELKELAEQRTVRVVIFDIRNEEDYNLFHIPDSTNLDFSNIESQQFADELVKNSANTVYFLVGNGESDSTKAWKFLKALGAINIYILDGGVNHWLEVFPLPSTIASKNVLTNKDILNYQFEKSVGSRYSILETGLHHDEKEIKPNFEKKVKLQRKKSVIGGCG